MAGISAQNSVIKVNTGTSEVPVWLKINGIKSFTTPDGSTSEIDVTDLDSVAMEYIAGMVDEGNFGYEGNELAADPGQIAVKAARASREITGFQITLPNLDVLTFDALVKNVTATAGVNAVLSMKVDTKVTGPVVVS